MSYASMFTQPFSYQKQANLGSLGATGNIKLSTETLTALQTRYLTFRTQFAVDAPKAGLSQSTIINNLALLDQGLARVMAGDVSRLDAFIQTMESLLAAVKVSLPDYTALGNMWASLKKALNDLPRSVGEQAAAIAREAAAGAGWTGLGVVAAVLVAALIVRRLVP